MSKKSNKRTRTKSKVSKSKSRPSRGYTLDPASKRKGGVMSPANPIIGKSGNPYRLIGASLGATVKIGDSFLRLDAWESRLVEDEPGSVEEAKRELFHDLIAELEMQRQEAEEELVDD